MILIRHDDDIYLINIVEGNFTIFKIFSGVLSGEVLEFKYWRYPGNPRASNYSNNISSNDPCVVVIRTEDRIYYSINPTTPNIGWNYITIPLNSTIKGIQSFFWGNTTLILILIDDEIIRVKYEWDEDYPKGASCSKIIIPKYPTLARVLNYDDSRKIYLIEDNTLYAISLLLFGKGFEVKEIVKLTEDISDVTSITINEASENYETIIVGPRVTSILVRNKLVDTIDNVQDIRSNYNFKCSMSNDILTILHKKNEKSYQMIDVVEFVLSTDENIIFVKYVDGKVGIIQSQEKDLYYYDFPEVDGIITSNIEFH